MVKIIEAPNRGTFQLKNFSKNDIGHAEHHKDGTYGLGYKLTINRNNVDIVLSHAFAPGAARAAVDAANDAIKRRIKINDISSYVLP